MSDNFIQRLYRSWWKTDCRRCLQIRAALLWGVIMYVLLTLFWW